VAVHIRRGDRPGEPLAYYTGLLDQLLAAPGAGLSCHADGDGAGSVRIFLLSNGKNRSEFRPLLQRFPCARFATDTAARAEGSLTDGPPSDSGSGSTATAAAAAAAAAGGWGWGPVSEALRATERYEDAKAHADAHDLAMLVGADVLVASPSQFSELSVALAPDATVKLVPCSTGECPMGDLYPNAVRVDERSAAPSFNVSAFEEAFARLRALRHLL
jgi:hypothetical protein